MSVVGIDIYDISEIVINSHIRIAWLKSPRAASVTCR